MDEYKIHKNGGRPYVVKVEEKTISIYSMESISKAKDAEWKTRCSDKWEREYEITEGLQVLIQPDWTKKIYNEIFTKPTSNDYSDLVNKYTFIKIFIGTDSNWGSNKYTSKGNTILLKLDKNKYVYIGGFIYEFETDDEITHYYSMIGPSDTPRPIAVSNGYIYFLQNQRYVNKETFEKRFINEGDKLDYMGWNIWDYFITICNSDYIDEEMVQKIKNIQHIASSDWC